MPSPMVAVVAAAEGVAAAVPVAALGVPAELELVARQELLAARVAADTVMMSDFLTPVHPDGFTRATSERGCFVSKGAISLGLAAVGLGSVKPGLGVASLVGITHARPTAAGPPRGRRRTCAIPKGLTTRSGSTRR